MQLTTGKPGTQTYRLQAAGYRLQVCAADNGKSWDTVAVAVAVAAAAVVGYRLQICAADNGKSWHTNVITRG